MKVTYNWLKELVDFNHTPEQLADLLTMLGLEVEAIQTFGEDMDDVVVAVVESKQQHPNADKLSVCKVNTGRELLDIVCGAQNFKQGDFVAVAQIGATLPGDFKIKRSKIRGEESCGMLCSEKELGLADDSAGIMILPNNLELGMPVFQALGLKDTFFEIGLTPNRADCLSVIGVAREIAAKVGKKVKFPRLEQVEAGLPVNEKIGVVVEDTELCPRYAARYISGCRIAPSPDWLVKRLNSIGIRSINNVVDITNLIMMEMGQPLHAFDCNHLNEQRIVVRRADDGELFTTLDSQERKLKNDDLVICDASRPVAIAGIMGGENSEISATTENILLESAWFSPTAIRKTSKRLGLHTESSHRFERGVNIDGVIPALDRAASLIVQLAGGCLAKGLVDIYPLPQKRQEITLRPERANQLIGINLPHNEIKTILESLDCSVEENEGNFVVIPPGYRIDIEREVDLIEEIARLNGYDNIPATMPTAKVSSERPTRHQQLEKKVRNILVASGMHEIINFSFTSANVADKLLLNNDDLRRVTIKLANPLVEEQAVMRTTLLPGILETVASNINFRMLDLALFEMRRVYMTLPDAVMPYEPIFISGAITGLRTREGWNNRAEPVDFYDAKGVVENLLEQLNIDRLKWVVDIPEPYYHPGKSCSIFAGKERIGSVGEIHPTVLENFAIEKPLYCFELDFEKLLTISNHKSSINVPSKFPDSYRDIAILAPADLSADKITECICQVKSKELEQVEIFDLYSGKGIPEGFKSVAVRVRYRSYEKTLTDEEIAVIHNKIIDFLLNKLKVSIR